MKEIKVLDKSFYKAKRGISGLGLFAEKDIKKGDWIIEYIGIVRPNKEVEGNTTKYLFEVNNRITIDGSPRWNTARYINHSCKRGNAESDIIKAKVYIKAIKNIAKGDEITYDYGKEYFDEFIKPYGCMCETCKLKVAKKPVKKVVKK
jgi:SET domain-containing protein